MLTVTGRKFDLRLDGDSGPSQHRFEVVRVARSLVMVGSHLDEDTAAAILEEVLQDPFFDELRSNATARTSAASASVSALS